MDTWKELEKGAQKGLAKSIGLSNFNKKQVERVLQIASIKPVMNQVKILLSDSNIFHYALICYISQSPPGKQSKRASQFDVIIIRTLYFLCIILLVYVLYLYLWLK